MDITRREFAVAAAGTAVVIGLAGCGEQGSPNSGGGGGKSGGGGGGGDPETRKAGDQEIKPGLGQSGGTAATSGGGGGAAPGEIAAAKLVGEPFLIGRPGAFAAARLYDNFSQSGVWLVSDGKMLIALSSTCTHKGCPVRWRPTENGFFCKCHGSRFDGRGIVLAGQKAQRPLERCALRLVEGQIEVDPNRRFRKDGQVDQFNDPAASIGVG